MAKDKDLGKKVAKALKAKAAEVKPDPKALKKIQDRIQKKKER